MNVPPELIEFASKLSIVDLIKYIASGAAVIKWGKDGLNYLKLKVKEYFDMKKYGFVVSEAQAQELQKISHSEAIRLLQGTVPDHPDTELICLGIHINHLNQDPKNKFQVKNIRDEVHETHGPKGIKAVDLGSTGVITEIASFLHDLKVRKKYPPQDLYREFDRLIDTWQKITFFVQNSDSKKWIQDKIVAFMKSQVEYFFIFAMGASYEKTAILIVEMKSKNLIQHENYMFFNQYHSRKDGLDSGHWVFEFLGPVRASVTSVAQAQ